MEHAFRRGLSSLLAAALLWALMPVTLAVSFKGNNYAENEDKDSSGNTLLLDTEENGMTRGEYATGDDVLLHVSATVEDSSGERITNQYKFSFEWEGDVDEPEFLEKSSLAYLDSDLASCTAVCYVTATPITSEEDETEGALTNILRAYVQWTAEASDYYDLEVEATLYNDGGDYRFDEEDDEGRDSIEEQISDAVYEFGHSDRELVYVEFSTVSVAGKGDLSAERNQEYYYCEADYGRDDELLGDVLFQPAAGFKGDVKFEFTAYYYRTATKLSYVDGVIVFHVEEDLSGNSSIRYTAIRGENVVLDQKDLEEFWTDQYPDGELEYVRFTDVYGGNLYDNYEGGKRVWTDVEEEETLCYPDPSGTHIGLNDLTFVPASERTTSATIQFTARGTNDRGSRTRLNGGITILYTEKEVKPIAYTSNSAAVNLKSADFIAQYQEAMGVSRVGSLEIQFLEVPAHGTLYMNYANGQGTALTGATVMNVLFSASATPAASQRSLDSVAYFPGKDTTADTVSFACYSGGKLVYVSTVRFSNVKLDPILVELSCGYAGVTFRSDDFFDPKTSALSSATLTFGLPSRGALYTGYLNGRGLKVSYYSDKFAATAIPADNIASIDTVTYIPDSNGVATIPFTVTTTSGTQVEGAVRITASVLNPTESIPATGTAYATAYSILVDGKEVKFDTYALRDASNNETNYLKLRDIAYVLNGTKAQFQVSWDDVYKNINVLPGQSYTSNQSEMSTPFAGKDQPYKVNTSQVLLNGISAPLTSIVLTDANGNGYTYFKVRDLGAALGFDVSWDSAAGCIVIDTSKPYTG